MPRSRKRKSSDTPAAEPTKWFDMFVPMTEDMVSMRMILRRLKELGYQGAALTYIKYGKPTKEDEADTAIPKDTVETLASDQNLNGFVIKRRIHFVIESVSDLPHTYSWKGHGYDFVSTAPGNDTVFQSVCNSTEAPKILTLDYTKGRNQLPFTLRSNDVRKAHERGVIFEIPYAPFVIGREDRKNAIKACTELQMSSVGIKIRVLFSSGARLDQATDLGVLALRSSHDISNLISTVFRFDPSNSQATLGEFHDVTSVHRNFHIGEVRKRNIKSLSGGVQESKGVSLEIDNEDKADSESKDEGSDNDNKNDQAGDHESSHDSDNEDGFIAF